MQVYYDKDADLEDINIKGSQISKKPSETTIEVKAEEIKWCFLSIF